MATETIGARRDGQDKGGTRRDSEYREQLLYIPHDLISLPLPGPPDEGGRISLGTATGAAGPCIICSPATFFWLLSPQKWENKPIISMVLATNLNE